MKENELRKNRVYLVSKISKTLQFCGLILLSSIFSFSQSTDQNLPTPISSNQINGEIKARDIGDSRLTTYYFVFNGGRGDIFINVVTNNLNGDIDIFTLEGLKPRTKITLFADSSNNETGRVIYMRKPEKLLLRIQGRTPNDDPATYQIKFAGSFEPIQGVAKNDDSFFPEAKSSGGGTVKVNSVGTIIEQPKPKPTPTEVVAENKKDDDVTNNKKVTKNETVSEDKTDKETKNTPEISSTFDPTKKLDDIIKDSKIENNPRVLVTDPFKDVESKSETKKDETENIEPKEVTLDIGEKKSETSAIVRIERDKEPVEKPNPLAKIFLKVELKNGETFERPMSEVLSMNIVKGVLTVVTSDGKIQEFSILDVVKTTIE